MKFRTTTLKFWIILDLILLVGLYQIALPRVLFDLTPVYPHESYGYGSNN